MTTLRKAMPLLLLCAALLVCLPLAAQTQDCSFTYPFTGDGTYTVANLSGNTPCVNWRITLSVTGSLSTTATFYTSPDNSTFTVVPNTVCSSTVQPPCILQGANPIVGTQGMMYVAAYGAFVRVITSSSSGTGHGTIRGYGIKGASAAALPSSGSGGGSGTVVSVATSSPITGGTITGSGTIGLDTTKVAQKFFGTSAPGSVATNLPGDLFTDTTAHNEYVCNAPSGTAAPACTSVTAAGWLLINGGGGGSGTVTNTGTLTANAVILGNGGVDVKPGAVLPADATKFYNGAGAFTTPASTPGVACPENPISMSIGNTYTCTDNLGVATGKFLWCQDPNSTPVNAAVQVSWAGATINTFTWVAAATQTVNCYASQGAGGGGSAAKQAPFVIQSKCSLGASVTFFQDVVAADVIAVITFTDSATPTVADSGGTNYTLILAHANGVNGAKTSMFRALAASSGPLTITQSGASLDAICAVELGSAQNVTDGTAAVDTAGSDPTAALLSIATTSPADLIVFGSISYHDGTVFVSGPPSFTSLSITGSGSLSIGYRDAPNGANYLVAAPYTGASPDGSIIAAAFLAQ